MTDMLEPTEGARAINFSLPDVNGKPVALADYLSKKNVYIFFIRDFN